MSEKKPNSKNTANSEQSANGAAIDRIFEESRKQYRRYLELRDVSRIRRRAPRPAPPPPTPENPLVGTNFKKLFEQRG